MPKSPDAFRTISEVAEWLDIPAHVLRFWESKFTQVKPIKRAGGRRYYRPADMLLLGGIKRLLHDDGLTIKGVQKILREEGMNHVAAMSGPLDELDGSDLANMGADTVDMPETLPPAPDLAEPESVVLPFEVARADSTAPAPQDAPAMDSDEIQADHETSVQPDDQPDDRPEDQTVGSPSRSPVPPADTARPEQPPEPIAPITVDARDATPVAQPPQPQPDTADDAPDAEQAPPDAPAKDADGPAAQEDLPAFLREPMQETEAPHTDNTPVEHAPPEDAPAGPKPRAIQMPPLTPEADISASPRALAAALRCRKLSPAAVKDIAPLVARLSALRNSMVGAHKPATKD